MASPETHARIIKAVSKRKDLDLLFKYRAAEKGLRYKLAATSEGPVLTIKMNRMLTAAALLIHKDNQND